MKLYQKYITSAMVLLSLTTSLVACSSNQTQTVTPAVTEEPENSARRGIQTASTPSTFGTNSSYGGEIDTLFSDFLTNQMQFAQAAEVLYMEDASDADALNTYKEYISNIRTGMLTADTLSPPESLVDLHMEMVDNAFVVIWILDQFEEEFDKGLDFATEKDRLVFEGLSTYYSGVSMDFVKSITAIQEEL